MQSAVSGKLRQNPALVREKQEKQKIVRHGAMRETALLSELRRQLLFLSERFPSTLQPAAFFGTSQRFCFAP